VPEESVIVIENIPMNPVVAAIASPAAGAVEGRNFQIKLVQRFYIAGKNDVANTLKILCLDRVGKLTRKAVTDDLSSIARPKEFYETCFMLALSAYKAVLGNGRWRSGFGIHIRNSSIVKCESPNG
jgi:hypothetical protein